MRNLALFSSSALISSLVLVASGAGATTYYVGPSGSGSSCCTRDTPCDLGAVASIAMAGDTVILMDGVYKAGLTIPNSGTASAWITFQADDCALPIIEGPGVGPAEDNQDSGVYSATATYVKFVGLVSRGWSTGFGNGWTGSGTTNSNGNWDIQYCIADGNGRTGFTFFSAAGFHLKNSISAHNGSSTAHAWSSGVTLYESTGGNVEGNISFENMDAEKHTDGSGFIADESSHNATFVNNVAFRNGGSCLRLTKSSGTKFINNTCYHDAQDAADTGPTNPSELYFTKADDNSTTTNTTFMNNVLVATGTGPGAQAVQNQPTTGWANNVVKTGSVSYFTAVDGDLTLASGATDLIGKGGTGTGVPTTDVGFDPKCIAKKDPVLVGQIAKGSWWQYSIEYDYIKSIGGVAKCFNPKMRSGTPDVGAYANGAVTTAAANSCMPGPSKVTVDPACMSSSGGAGGAPASGGAPATGGASTAGSGSALGGATSVGGMPSSGGAPGTGGTVTNGGAPATGATGGTAPTSGAGGTGTNAGGSSGSSTGGSVAGGTGGSVASGATGGSQATSSGGTGASDGNGSKDGASDSSGCGCRVASEAPQTTWLGSVAFAALAVIGLRRRGARRRGVQRVGA
jgi:serralysin